MLPRKQPEGKGEIIGAIDDGNGYSSSARTHKVNDPKNNRNIGFSQYFQNGSQSFHYGKKTISVVEQQLHKLTSRALKQKEDTNEDQVGDIQPVKISNLTFAKQIDRTSSNTTNNTTNRFFSREGTSRERLGSSSRTGTASRNHNYNNNNSNFFQNLPSSKTSSSCHVQAHKQMEHRRQKESIEQYSQFQQPPPQLVGSISSRSQNTVSHGSSLNYLQNPSKEKLSKTLILQTQSSLLASKKDNLTNQVKSKQLLKFSIDSQEQNTSQPQLSSGLSSQRSKPTKSSQLDLFLNQNISKKISSLAHIESVQVSTRKSENAVSSNFFKQPHDGSILLNSYQLINDDFTNKLDWINKIESKNFNSISTLDPFEINAQLFKKIPKKNNLPAPNVISKSTIEPQSLSLSQSNLIKCEMNDFIYFKVHVIEHDSPLKLRVQAENILASVKIFTSKTCLQPNNFNCDLVFYNSKIITIDEEKGLPTFRRQKYIYFSIMSDQSQDIHVRVTFGQEQIGNIKHNNNILTNITRHAKKPQNNNNNNSTAREDPMEEGLLISEERQLKRSVMEIFFEKERKLNESGNIIQKNILSSRQIDQFTRCLSVYSKRKSYSKHLKRVTEKAEQIAAAKIEVIQKHQDEKIRKQIAKINTFRMNFFVFFWGQIIKMIKITEYVKGKFMEKKEAIRLFSKIAWQSLPLSRQFKVIQYLIFRSKYPQDLLQNNLRYARISLETYANIINAKAEQESGKILAFTLKQNYEFANLKNRMRKYYETVMSVQMSYKIFRIKKANFKKLLLKLWDKYYLMGMDQTIEVLRNGENDQLFWRKKQHVLSLLNTQDNKNDAIEAYFKELMAHFRNQITIYLSQFIRVPEEQKKRFGVLQAICNPEDPNQQSQIFENYNENDADNLDVSFDHFAGGVGQHKEREFMKKPRLFVVPTFKSIKAVLRQGVICHAVKDPEILEKIIIKEV